MYMLGTVPLRFWSVSCGIPRRPQAAHKRPDALARLGVVRDLFYWDGIRATGVDRVAFEAGVAPTTLYRLFASKYDLVAAYVEREDRLCREWFGATVEAAGQEPRERILALFDALAEQVQPERCRGCPFMLALSEFPDDTLDGHQSAVRVKKWVRVRIRRLVDELCSARARRGSDAAALADHLMLLFEGVYATAQSLGPDGPARRARALVANLVR